jgi:predicted DNA binding CopG/RHH family protein
MEDEYMRDSYDFSNAQKNPYITKLKKQITIRLDEETIDYFKEMSEESGIKYQQLINLYLADCAKKNLKLNINWKAS